MTVLLVEKDAVERRAARERLAADGFQVVEAESADAAGLALALRDDIVVVITDVETPGCMTGGQLADLLARQAPWISVIVVSGSADATDRVGFQTLRKPYSLEVLVKAVRAAAAAALQLRAR